MTDKVITVEELLLTLDQIEESSEVRGNVDLTPTGCYINMLLKGVHQMFQSVELLLAPRDYVITVRGYVEGCLRCMTVGLLKRELAKAEGWMPVMLRYETPSDLVFRERLVDTKVIGDRTLCLYNRLMWKNDHTNTLNNNKGI